MYRMLNAKKTKMTLAGLLGLAFVCLSSGLYAKGKNYGAAGCGVGSLIFSDNSKGSQVLASTTNTTFTQTSSITSQTSNCYDEGAGAYLQYRQEEFVAVNYSDLQQQMAVGQGEKLEAFALLLGCDASNSFVSMAQKSYADFFAVPVNKPAEFVERVKTGIKADSQASRACKLKA